jgi:hypothetical protein
MTAAPARGKAFPSQKSWLATEPPALSVSVSHSFLLRLRLGERFDPGFGDLGRFDSRSTTSGDRRPAAGYDEKDREPI